MNDENRRVCKLDPEIPKPKDGDGFTDDLKIPEGLVLAEPEPYGDNAKKAGSTNADFKLFDGSQGGIYKYQATVNIEEDGEVYLRAYEVTKGTRLSADRIKQRTLEKVTVEGIEDFSQWDKDYNLCGKAWASPMVVTHGVRHVKAILSIQEES